LPTPLLPSSISDLFKVDEFKLLDECTLANPLLILENVLGGGL
jgi:hypothetical protein